MTTKHDNVGEHPLPFFKEKPGPERWYIIRFTVRSRCAFPLDMLRRDRCCPVDEIDSEAMAAEGSDRIVRLARFSKAGKAGPRVAYWRSFGWEVTRIEYHDGTMEEP